MRQLLEAGVHFGHQTRRWNPKMKRFIFGERNGIYIIDLNQTLERIDTAYSFVRDLVADGGIVLFVGTKKQTQDPVARYAQQLRHAVRQRALARRHAHQLQHHRGRGSRRCRSTSAMQAAGDFEAMPKKEALDPVAELDKLQRNLGGIRDMTDCPTPSSSSTPRRSTSPSPRPTSSGCPSSPSSTPTATPTSSTYVIPGNDDAIRAGTLMCRVIADAVEEGRFIAANRPVPEPRPLVGGRCGRPRRRPARGTTGHRSVRVQAAEQTAPKRSRAAAEARHDAAETAEQRRSRPPSAAAQRRPDAAAAASDAELPEPALRLRTWSRRLRPRT